MSDAKVMPRTVPQPGAEFAQIWPKISLFGHISGLLEMLINFASNMRRHPNLVN